MKEITGNLWHYRLQPYHVVCITTNGTVKVNGRGVMGRGCAREALYLFPQLERTLGALLKLNGNHVAWLMAGVISFPVKYNWWEEANLELISQSARELKREVDLLSHATFILPRPGCGNGHRTWEEVKPLLVDLPDNVHVITEAK